MKKYAVSFLLSLLIPAAVIAQQSGNTSTDNTATGSSATSSTQVGGISKSEFDRINKEGAANVAAIKPNSAPLSAADKELMMKVAMGGMQQLLVSQNVLQKATNEQIRQLAQAEVEEQTGLAAKLKEIAAAKGIALLSSPDSETKAMLDRYKEVSGEEADRYYIAESGVKGHEKLDKVMGMVHAQAKDEALKKLAGAAHPLVKTHLQVARATLNQLSSATGNK